MCKLSYPGVNCISEHTYIHFVLQYCNLFDNMCWSNGGNSWETVSDCSVVSSLAMDVLFNSYDFS